MAGARCDQCGVEEYMPYACKFCKGRFCAAHRLPENHACQGLGAYREKMRQEGRIVAPFPGDEPVAPSMSATARAGATMDSLWAKADGKMTYVFLGIIVAVFLLEWATLLAAPEAFDDLWVIQLDFLVQPWTILTSVFAHDPYNFNHILFNSLGLLFFGHTVEKLIGTKRYTWLILGSGALAGIAEVVLMKLVFNDDVAALGASGALMGAMGTLVILAPTISVLVFFVIPAPLWSLVILYVLLDLVGFISPGGGVANAAHLTGLAIGLWFGWSLRKRGLRTVVRKAPPMWNR